VGKTPSRAQAAKPTAFVEQPGAGGETHRRIRDDADHADADAHLTTNQGIRISDNQNSLKAGARSRRCSRTSSFARRSSTSTTSGFPSASSMRADRFHATSRWSGSKAAA
jgi:hypothetical protein